MREYLPALLGNTQAKARLGSAIERGRFAHAFLICGPDGSGKMTMAKEITAALNCERSSLPGSPLPCGVCNCCARIRSESFPDMRILRRSAERATVGVAQVKEIREDMFLSATESRFKVYIFDDAHTMTPEAQNSLLKVLEEPPEGVVMMLLASEGDKILTTIKSRAQYVSTERFDTATLERHLTERSSAAAAMKTENPEKLKDIVMSAGGVLGEALRLTEDKYASAISTAREDALAVLTAALGSKSYAEVRTAIMRLPTKRQELGEYLEQMIRAVRDMLCSKMSPDAPTVFFVTAKEADAASEGASAARLAKVYDIIFEAYEYTMKNANVGGLVANLAAKLC